MPRTTSPGGESGLSSALAALLLALALTLSPRVVQARTLPTEVSKLLALKTELERRGLGYLLDTWTCAKDGECDPCGPTAGERDSWGAWHYVACRWVPSGERAAAEAEAKVLGSSPVAAQGEPSYSSSSSSSSSSSRGRKLSAAPGQNAGEASRGKDAVWGLVTNIHLSDLAIEGTLESMEGVLCPFRHLRELDLDGGRLTGPVPGFIGRCFPHLTELDLSHNQLSGTLPAGIWRGVPSLEQAKLEDNRLTGTIPGALASLGDLRVLWLNRNDLSGSIPVQFGASNAMLKILSLNLEDNPNLCGNAPRRLDVNWRWQLDNQAETSRDWFAFCEKDACGIFIYGGTDVGKQCPQSGIKVKPSCGKLWDQCGGTEAVEIQMFKDAGYGDDEDGTITVDVPFDGAKCCRRGMMCAEMEHNETRGTSFSQCILDPDWGLPAPKTEVPDHILREYRRSNGAASSVGCTFETRKHIYFELHSTHAKQCPDTDILCCVHSWESPVRSALQLGGNAAVPRIISARSVVPAQLHASREARTMPSATPRVARELGSSVVDIDTRAHSAAAMVSNAWNITGVIISAS